MADESDLHRRIKQLEYIKTGREDEAPASRDLSVIAVHESTESKTAKVLMAQSDVDLRKGDIVSAVKATNCEPSDGVNSIVQRYEDAERRGYDAGQKAAASSYESERNKNVKLIAAAIQALEVFQETLISRSQADIIAISLKTAEKILCRRLEMDGLFLAASVRHLIEKIHNSTNIILKVCALDHLEWLNLIGNITYGNTPISVLIDPALDAGMCVVESGEAVVDFSVAAQLDEISREFKRILKQVAPPAYRKAE